MDVGNNILIRKGVAYPADPQELQGRIERQSIQMLKDQIRDTAWRLQNPTRTAVEAVVRYRLTSMQGACARALMHMTDFEFYDEIEEDIRDEVQELQGVQMPQEALNIEKGISKFKRKKGHEALRGNHNWWNKQTKKKQKTSNQASGSSTQNSLRCYNCGGEGHKAQSCTKPRGLHVRCFNCGGMGHYNSDCKEPRRNIKTGECSRGSSRCRSL